jgi:hypothetical protein
MGFEILPGTGGNDLTPEKKAFEQEPPSINAISINMTSRT